MTSLTFVSMFKQFYTMLYIPPTTHNYTQFIYATLTSAHKCDIVIPSLTQNSFTSKYTSTTCTKLREHPHITSSDRGERGF